MYDTLIHCFIPVLWLYGNYFIDLWCKSMDWFHIITKHWLEWIKGTSKWTKWICSNFSSLTMFEFINQDKVTFFLARASQIFSTFLSKWNMCTSLWLQIRERPKKYFPLSGWCRIIWTWSLIFLFDNINIKMESSGP